MIRLLILLIRRRHLAVSTWQEAGARVGAALIELRCERTPHSWCWWWGASGVVCRQQVGYVRRGLVSLRAGHSTLAAAGDFQVCFLNACMPVVLPIFAAYMQESQSESTIFIFKFSELEESYAILNYAQTLLFS